MDVNVVADAAGRGLGPNEEAGGDADQYQADGLQFGLATTQAC